MEVSLARRVEMGLGTLTPTERNQIQKAFKEIGLQSLDQFHQNPKVRPFTARSGKHLYAYPGNKEFQIVLSFNETTCVVEDIILKERLRGFLANHSHPVQI